MVAKISQILKELLTPMIFSKTELKKRKLFLLEVIQSYLSQPALESISSPQSLMDVFDPILELLKTCEDIDINSAILTLSNHLLKVLFKEKFEESHVGEFLELFEEYMIKENLDIKKRQRLLKFKCFVQQASKTLLYDEDAEEETAEPEAGVEETEESAENRSDKEESEAHPDSILGLVVAPASFAAARGSKASSFERQYNLGERRRKTFEKQLEATESLRKIELQDQMRLSPNKQLSSSPTKGARAQEVASDLSKSFSNMNEGPTQIQTVPKVEMALSESSSEITQQVFGKLFTIEGHFIELITFKGSGRLSE